MTLPFICGSLTSGTMAAATTIPSSDSKIQNGLSPYNWVCKEDSISSAVCGASVKIGFKGAREVALQVDTENITTGNPNRFPIIAWTVNGGELQIHQLKAKEGSIPLSSGVADPVIDLYIRGMSPFENRFAGDVPPNAVKITGFSVDSGETVAVPVPEKIWLNIGDSIMSGDGAAYRKGQGRPPDDLWAASDEARASYGYLLAQHFGFREARLAYGGYNWAGATAGVPGVATMIDQKTSTVSRLTGEVLSPVPDLVLINLGENGVPADTDVIQALTEVRSRIGAKVKMIMMIPVSGRGQAELTRAFNAYKSSTKDEQIALIDLGKLDFATGDGQHPTEAGHQAIFKKARPVLDPIVSEISGH